MTNTDWPTTELAREWTHRGITCRVYVADYTLPVATVCSHSTTMSALRALNKEEA